MSYSARSLGSLLLVASALACGREPGDGRQDRAAPEAHATADSPSAPRSGATVKGTAARVVGRFPAVVTLEPATVAPASKGESVAAPPSELPPSYMDQIAIAFYPPTLLARVGGPVVFSNGENLMHNVTVSRDENQTLVFNVVTPPGFEPYRHTFVEPGIYRVACNIHPGMSAVIVAVTTPYASVADLDGGYVIEDVAPGRYLAAVWSVDPALRVERPVEIAIGQAIVDLDLAPAPGAE